ncbi:MAG: carboxypeptidase regulatory-like domain-containing protein [Bacteroidales bacterium]|nr:carboxypeptidase regulatory-like domain-containing protein [Bacteroidales bacterium]
MSSHIPLGLLEIIAILVLTSLPLAGQGISGRVSDAKDGKPLPGVVVRTLDTRGKTLKYVTTDKDGRFNVTSGPDDKVLIVAFLGYNEQRIEAPFENDYDIRLVISSERIKESMIQARKVQMAGDTTTYNVKALSTREDRVLVDVLRRIPGIEVTSTGHLKVDGKDLGKFYVNGKDVLEGNYNLATRKLSVDAVKKIEVLRNHQYIKMLRGMQESDMSAVNIVTEEGVKGKVNASGSSGVGYMDGRPRLPNAERLTAFYLGDIVTSVSDVSFDASGKAVSPTQSLKLPMDENRHSIDSRLNMASTKAPLSDSRSLFNKTLDSRTVNTLTPSETVKAGATFSYSWDERTSSDNRFSVYHLEDGERIIFRQEERLERGNKLTGKLNYSNNGSRFFAREILFADLGKTKGSAEVTGDDQRLQTGDKKRWDLDNNLNMLFKIGSRRVLGVKSYTQITGFQENLNILSSTPRQHIGSSAIFEDLYFSDIMKTSGRITYSIRPTFSWTLFERDASLKGLLDNEVPGLKNDSSRATYFSGGFSWSALYKVKNLSFSLNGTLRYDRASFGDYHVSKVLSDGDAQVKFETARFVANVEGGLGTSKPDIQDLGSVLILYDYDGLRRGQESLSFLPTRFIREEFIFREPVNGWYARLMSNYSKTRSLLGGRDVLENYILSYNTDEAIGYRTWSSGVEITKGLYSINGKISARVSHLRSSSTFRQNGMTSKYVSETLSPSLEVITSPLSFWNIDASGKVGFASMRSGSGKSGRTSNIRATITNSFYFSKRVSVGAIADIFHNSTVGKTTIFPDAFISWTGRDKTRIKLTATNLMNQKEYSYVSLSPLQETTHSYRIRPLSVILSADWTF